MRTTDLTGKRFGRLTVVEKGEPKICSNGTRLSTWVCDCDCGKRVTVRDSSLKSGMTQSCGCKFLEYSRRKRKNNQYDFTHEYGIGYTNQGQEFFFDKEDYDRLKYYCWSMNKRGILSAAVPGHQGRKRIMMHRLVMNVDDKRTVNHLGSPSDNRKCNLEVVEAGRKSYNHKVSKKSSSGITGVAYNPTVKKWEAYIHVQGKKKRLGYFKDIDAAAKARKEAELIY